MALHASNHRRVAVLDGGTGEELLTHRGVTDDRKTWSATAVSDATFHATLRNVHTDFLQAGSEYITVNNFALTPGVFGDSEASLCLIKRLTRIAGEIAREAADTATELEPNAPKRVLASLPPLIESYRPDLAMNDHAAAVERYRSLVVDVLDDLVDGYIAETLSSSSEAIDAMDAVADVQGSKLLFVSMCVKRGGMVRSGETARVAIRSIVQHWLEIEKKSWEENGKLKHKEKEKEGSGHGERASRVKTPLISLQAVMFNCSTPEDILAALQDVHADDALLQLLDDARISLGVYPNRLTPIKDDWTMETSDAPQATRTDFGQGEFIEWSKRVVRTFPRVRVVGGCCGIRPGDIRGLVDELESAE